MNAITFLKKEHNKVRKAFAQISKQTRRFTSKKQMFKKLCQDLIRHETMEQKVWYPHFKNSKKIKKEVRHLLSEEKYAEKAIKKLKKAKTQDQWEDKFSKFKKDVVHHANEEEQKLFPNVRAILNKQALLYLGAQMQKFKSKYKKKML